MGTKIEGTLYLVTPQKQKAEVDKLCFGSCGQILVGAIEYGPVAWFPCRQQNCPHNEREALVGKGTVFGKEETIVLRKLVEAVAGKG